MQAVCLFQAAWPAFPYPQPTQGYVSQKHAPVGGRVQGGEMNSLTERIVDILRKSRDGDLLDLPDLALIEMAINGRLTEKGERHLDSILQRLNVGSYRRRWLHGIPNLTADLKGLVYWRGIEVECYRDPYSSESTTSLLELADRCRHIESLGLQPTSARVVANWRFLCGLSRDNPYFGLFAFGFKEYLVRHRDEWMLVFNDNWQDIEVTGAGAMFVIRSVPWEDAWHARRKQGFKLPSGVADQCANVHSMTTLLHSRQVPTDIERSAEGFIKARRQCA